MQYVNNFGQIVSSSDLTHYGRKGMHWGERNGPPYPLSYSNFSRSEKAEAKKKKREESRNTIYAKKHFDKVIKEGTTISTLSRDKDRAKNSDMFYATYDLTDKAKYMKFFNKKAEEPVKDENGNTIGTDKFYMWKIDNKAKSNIKVASEDSAVKSFKKLYKENKDFHDYITNPDRMKSHIGESRYKFKSYNEARKVLEKIQNDRNYRVTNEDLSTIYRMFNYSLPSDGRGNAKMAKDVKTQRAKFFKELSKNGYGALLDTNDAMYGAFEANAPVIVFDTTQLVPEKIRRTSFKDRKIASLVYTGRRLIGK